MLISIGAGVITTRAHIFTRNKASKSIVYLEQCFHISNKFYFPCLQVYCLGTILSMQISFVGFQPVQSSEHMAVSGVLQPLLYKFSLLVSICSFSTNWENLLEHQKFLFDVI